MSGFPFVFEYELNLIILCLRNMENGTLALNVANPDEYAKAISLPWWGVQLIAWFLFCVLSFLSLTLWYGNPRWMHVFHIVLQAVSGALVTWPLGRLLPFANRGGVLRRVLAHLVLVGAVALLWNIFRMATFDAMITAPDIWQDFGGWYFTALLIFGLWAALYYITQANFAVGAERAQAEAEKLRRIEAESLSREAQMKMLRYQINPHFLFNTLNSVSALVKTKRTTEARDMIEKLSGFLRFTLEDAPNTLINLRQEFELLDLYLGLEAVRYADRLKIERDIDPDTLDEFVPSLILQPLVENALRCAVAERRTGGTIYLSSGLEANALILRVGDSGMGFADTQVEGVGLSNIRKRLDAHYGPEAALAFGTSDLGGAEVIIRIPREMKK